MRIVPLGGLGEVGKNMTVFETEGGCVVGGGGRCEHCELSRRNL